MNRKDQVRRRGAISRRVPLFVICGLIVLAGLLPGLLTPSIAAAAGSIAMTGTWASQILQIPQGSSVTSQNSAYVVVFNPSGDSPITVNMNTIAPAGVAVSLSSSEFVVQPGGQRQVNVQQVSVSSDTVPGDYQVELVANAFYEDTGGVQILPAVGQTAALSVTGESALVVVEMVSPSGQPIWAVIRLFKLINGGKYEFAYSTTGHLEATVSPGRYRVEAYSTGGEPLAEPQEFDIADGEEQRLTLTANVIYFESFAINPAYNSETGELGYVQIVYTAHNVYQSVPNAEVTLTVTLDGTPLEEISIFTLNPFNIGRIGVPYNYSPADGWHGGTYGFSLQLYVDGELYASTQEQTLQVGSESALPWWIFVLAALGGGLIIGGIIMFLKRRRKQDKPEKAQKARKHEKKESPATGEESGGVVYGLKGLFSRKHKTAKRQAVPAKGTAAATGAVASTVAKKDAVPAAPAQTAAKASAAVDATKPSAQKPVVEAPAAAQASAVTPAAPAAQPTTAAVQASAVAKPPAAQPAAAQEARPAQAAAAPTPRPAQTAPAHVKSAADLKRVIASRQAEVTAPSAAATPTTHAKEASPLKDDTAAAPAATSASTSPTAAAAPRRDPLTVPSPFAAPREGPPTKKVRFARKGAVAGVTATPMPHAAPASGTGTAQSAQETAPARSAATPVTPETIEPLVVPSPFAAAAMKPSAEEATPRVQVPMAEPPEAAITPAEQAAPVMESPAPEPEPAREPAMEATVSIPEAVQDETPAIMQEDVPAGPGEETTDSATRAMPASGQPEELPPESQAEADEAAKKFVSPIRFLNR